MKRLSAALFAVSLSLALVVSTGCQRQVEVKTGTRTVCTYGHVISDDTRTIKVAEKDAGKFKVTTVTKTCDKHAQAEQLYSDAQSDITKGDLPAAEQKLAQVIAIDSAFKRAARQLADIKAKKTPTADTGAVTPPGGSSPATSTPEGGGEPPVGPVESLFKWVPDSIPGFAPAAKAGGDALSVSREYVPPSKGAVVMVTIVAEQFRDAAEAKTNLDRQLKRQYGGNAATVRVNGHDAYFGTSGQYAVIGFTDGAVMVAVEMMGRDGKPSALKDQIVGVAKALP